MELDNAIKLGKICQRIKSQVKTYLDNYAIYYWDLENFMYNYEFIPYDGNIIPFRKDYRNFINPNEPTKELIITIFGEKFRIWNKKNKNIVVTKEA